MDKFIIAESIAETVPNHKRWSITCMTAFVAVSKNTKMVDVMESGPNRDAAENQQDWVTSSIIGIKMEPPWIIFSLF